MKSTITRVCKETHTITLNESDVQNAIQDYVLASLKDDPQSRTNRNIEITFGQSLGNSYAAKVVITSDLTATATLEMPK